MAALHTLHTVHFRPITLGWLELYQSLTGSAGPSAQSLLMMVFEQLFLLFKHKGRFFRSGRLLWRLLYGQRYKIFLSDPENPTVEVVIGDDLDDEDKVTVVADCVWLIVWENDSAPTFDEILDLHDDYKFACRL